MNQQSWIEYIYSKSYLFCFMNILNRTPIDIAYHFPSFQREVNVCGQLLRGGVGTRVQSRVHSLVASTWRRALKTAEGIFSLLEISFSVISNLHHRKARPMSKYHLCLNIRMLKHKWSLAAPPDSFTRAWTSGFFAYCARIMFSAESSLFFPKYIPPRPTYV